MTIYVDYNMRKSPSRLSGRVVVRPTPSAVIPRVSTVLHIAAPERTFVTDESNTPKSLPNLEDP